MGAAEGSPSFAEADNKSAAAALRARLMGKSAGTLPAGKDARQSEAKRKQVRACVT